MENRTDTLRKFFQYFDKAVKDGYLPSLAYLVLFNDGSGDIFAHSGSPVIAFNNFEDGLTQLKQYIKEQKG